MKVLTLNCHFAYRRDALAAYLQEVLLDERYDFLLLQEADSVVKSIIAGIATRYVLHDAENPDTRERSQTSILALPTYALQSLRFLPFARFGPRCPHNGAIIGVFERRGERITVCSAHLHPGESFIARQREIAELKRHLSEGVRIIGGDFNNMFYRELGSIVRRMQPEFVHCTDYRTHSHDTTYLHTTALPTRIFASLGAVGLRFRTRLDHLFIDRESAKRFTWATKVHDVLVSDHRPVEVEFEPVV